MPDFTAIERVISNLLPRIEAAQETYFARHGRYAQCLASGARTTDQRVAWGDLKILPEAFPVSVEVYESEEGHSWALAVEDQGHRKQIGRGSKSHGYDWTPLVDGMLSPIHVEPPVSDGPP